MSFLDRIATRLGYIPKEKIFPPVTEGWTLTNPLAPLLGYTGGQEHKVYQPMAQVAAVYACVNAKATNIGGVDFKLYPRVSKGNQKYTSLVHKMAFLKQLSNVREITSGPVYELLQNINPIDTWYELMEQIVAFLELEGEWFIRKDEQKTVDGVPANLWPESPKNMDVAKTNEQWVGWWWNPGDGREKQFLAPGEVLFDRYPSPYRKIRGLSPLDAARLTLETDYNARIYNRNFFKNDGTPKVAYISKQDGQITDKQFKRLQFELIESRRGVDKAHDNMILDGFDVKGVGLSQKDIEFISQMKLTTEEVCMIYHTPKSIISVYEDTNYATAVNAKEQWWTDEIVPMMNRIEDKLNKELLFPLGVEGRFDLLHVDALAFAMINRVDAAQKLWQMGVPLNAINDRLEMGFEHFEWGDEPSAVSQGKNGPAVAGATPAKGIEAPRAQKDVTDLAAMTEALRTKEWNDIMARVYPIMGKMSRRVRTYFHEVEQRLLKTFVKGIRSGNLVRTKDAPTPDDIDNAFSNDELLRIEAEFLTEAATVGYKMFIQGVFNELPPEVQAEISKRATMVTEVNVHGREDIKKAIQDVLDQATKQGASEATTAQMLVDAMKGTMAKITKRAKTIARTEVHSAFSVARHIGMDKTKPSRKRWISSRDNRVRDTHRIDGQTRSFDEPFSNGLMYPMEPGAPPSEVINCRCIEVPVYEGE